jgi:hypothetical protein
MQVKSCTTLYIPESGGLLLLLVALDGKELPIGFTDLVSIVSIFRDILRK